MCRKQALFCSHRCVFLTTTEMESCRDCPLACMWDVHSSIKPQHNSLLAYQPSPVEGYSITSCNSNNHFHSCSLSPCVSPARLSVSCRLQSTSGNWKWAIRCAQRSATWESKRKSNALPSNSLQLYTFSTAETSLWATFTFRCVSTRSGYDKDALRLHLYSFLHEM